MKKEEHEVLFNVEDDYWWYVGLRDLIISSIGDLDNKDGKLKMLDAGCGTGKTLESCSGQEAYGLDFSKEALQYCKLRNLNNLLRASINNIPFKDDFFDVVVSLDVVGQCSEFKDDVSMLKEICRVVKKDGTLLLNLPAYKFIRSKHDIAVGINQRYTITELKSKLQSAGFEIEKISYRNSILFPVALIKRIIDKIFDNGKEEVRSDLKPLNFLVNKLLACLLILENKLIRAGVKFPFGLSIYCAAKKRNKKVSV